MAKNGLFLSKAAVGLHKGSSGDDVLELQQFLQRFGYLRAPIVKGDPFAAVRNPSAPLFTRGVFDEGTEEGLKTYQQFYGLPVTGNLDAATLTHINHPRCGVPDNPNVSGAAYFVAQGNRWNKPILTYRFQEFTADLTQQDIRNGVRAAFDLWFNVVPLNCREVAQTGDIVIRFVVGDHGDPFPFGSDLAHAFYPPPFPLEGDIHFNDAYTWTITVPLPGGQLYDLVSVAAHEIGHALGLDHTNVAGALMFPAYRIHRFLSQDDADGMRSIYGGRSTGNPALIQSRFGQRGNFELIVPLRILGGFDFYTRNNDAPGLPWNGPLTFAEGLGQRQVEAVTMIESNFANHLEVVAILGSRLVFFWRESAPSFAWNGPSYFGSAGISGNPVLIQSRFGRKGNFELVVPLTTTGMAFYWRNNDDQTLPWNGPFPFGQAAGHVDAVTMIQSNFGSPGNLEVVARIGDRLAFFWRDSGPGFVWNGPFFFGSPGVKGNPVLIQSGFGRKGNFELIVPLVSGGIAHYWRNNDVPTLPWAGPFQFAQGVGQVEAVTMIQSNFDRHLEVVARVGDRLAFFWRESAPPYTWNGPSFLN